MYQKVDTNLNFVDREKKVEKFWKENHILKKVWKTEKIMRPICFMTDRLQLMETAYWACAYPCDQGYDPKVSYHERIPGTP